MDAGPYRLPARLAPAAARLLADPHAVAEIVARFGTPVNVVLPEVFVENVARFRAVLDEHGVAHRICYAHKANQARAFAAAARRCGIGIDVASPAELDSAISAGFGVDRIEVTGPKGESFLRQLVESEVVVNVDNLWELGRLAELAAEHRRDAIAVLVRLSGFEPARPGTPPSRFGVDLADADAALDLVASAPDRIELRGFSFHLDTSSTAERVNAVAGCLEVAARAFARGLRPRVLDIGGGFRQAFSADPRAFHRYVRALLDGLNGDAPALGWPGHSFGYRRHAGRYAGTPSFHKYGNDLEATVLLRELLSARLPGGAFADRTVAAALRETMLELWLEPGKALLDHAGFTVATVEFGKRLADGSTMVTLDISRDTITPADQEVMIDPVVIHRHRAADYRPCPDGVFFGGRLCLERDMVMRHKVFPDRMPLPGDHVVFVNTAAYQMDFSAAAALMHPLPPKVVATELGSAGNGAARRGGFALEADR